MNVLLSIASLAILAVVCFAIGYLVERHLGGHEQGNVRSPS